MTYTFLEPYTFSNKVALRNRVLLAPMTTSSSTPEGTVTEDELIYYLVRSSGPGAVITACAYIDSKGQAFKNGMGASKDSHLNGLKKLAQVIKLQGAKAILQIYHGGRMSQRQFNGGRQPVSPSAIRAEREWADTPKELTETGIHILVSQFGAAVRRAIDAGFDGVELHGANTYLLQQFFSPHSNRRQDDWGGSLEKRLRFPIEVVRHCQSVIDAHASEGFLLGYRLSPEEVEEPGIRLTDTYVLIDALIGLKVDYIHLSVGHYAQPSIVGFGNYKKQIPQQIADYVSKRVPLIAVGSIQTAADAEKALEYSQLVSIGRQLIIEPKWVEKHAEGKKRSITHYIDTAQKPIYRLPDAMFEMITGIPGWFPVRDGTSNT
ncbi:Fumarate reductase flavoprotein subunit [Alkalibacterium sp. AK22]|uniref:NADH-dependent flavin oxidoreductase n=1 Tax=Alkalibacterium sp. AK22 TaxID=1229520 RepID=UPI00044DD825|nr:NADH-dependent flavin oxidoreductase [Alkalibacterium sp. AK22]EXJ23776.1 Fumarate reductase flavoprotein subunit [Alkalibacterium sp. AK22]